jgi:enolase
VLLALDCAASEFFKDGAYRMTGEGRDLSPEEMAAYLAELAAEYPIASIEDGMGEDDMAGWKALTDRSATASSWSATICSSPIARLADGIRDGIANSILVKVNQIGTLTETIDAVRLAQTKRLYRGDVAPIGRDRGFDDRRPRGRARLRADQDRQPGAQRPHRQV